MALADNVPVLSAVVQAHGGFRAATHVAALSQVVSVDAPCDTQSRAHGGRRVKEVLLFVDTFNNNMEPENARAAQRVLEAAGYTVHFNTRQGERPVCCGRTFLAAGLVDEAKQEARRMLDTFKPFVERGVPIVGLEPSCLLSLRDEFLHYGFGEEAQRLSKSAFLFEEFLVREQKAARRLELDLKPLPKQKALVHGHCHQKAFDAFTPGANRAELDSGTEGVDGRVVMLRDGGQLRLRSRALRDIAGDGGAVAAAGGAQDQATR